MSPMEYLLDANRPIPDREILGQHVRKVWIMWAKNQPDPKASWLVPWRDMKEEDKEVDRQIGEEIARLTLLCDAAKASMIFEPKD